jgi:hypothetical protein
MNNQNKQSDVCCPEFNPKLWDEKTHYWKGKPFIKDVVPQLFHMPLPGAMNRIITRMWNRIQEAGATPANMDEFLMLAYDPSPWKSEFYLTVTQAVPGAENVTLSGEFISKVFDGPFHAVPQWIKTMDQYVAAQGKTTKKYFFYYTTCPKCAQKYGHNYVVAFAQVE